MSGSRFQFGDLAGKSVLLTGATRGIGRGIAPGLAAQGLRLILVGRDPVRLQQIVDEIRDSGTQAEGVVCELSEPEGRREACRHIAELAPTLDAVIHNAAIDPRRSFDAMDVEFYRNVQAVNVEPAVEMTSLLLPNLRRSTGGRVVLIGSIAFELGISHLSAYVASKGALVGLTRSLAHELGPDGITVNCLSPGAVVVEKEAGRNTQETEQALVAWQAIKRRIVPADLLGPICLLLSRAGGMITGQTITVDGGLMHPIAAPSLQESWVE